MNPATKALLLARHLGLRWVAFRVRYALRKKSGYLVRAAPAGDWSEVTVPAEEAERRGLFAAPAVIGEGCLAEANAVLAGRFRFFSKHEVAAGFPPDWNRNQLSGEVVPAGAHWSALGDFAYGDIKGVWELSRFPWAFALARAYARTGDNRFAEGFWTLFEDWCTQCPPNRGPNWMCGQEVTFRLMAAGFARQICDRAPATTAPRRERFRQFVVVSGRRIAANLDYALSQSNNHGVSECVGLITASVLLPEQEESAGWRKTGLKALERQLSELVYADGGFSQHSAIYHRVLLHDLLWCCGVLRSAALAVPPWLHEAGQKAVAFIAALVTPETGRVPLYGPNDGANVLPLADADFLDFRPAIQAGAIVFCGERRLPAGPWDEAAEWLSGGAAAVSRPPTQVAGREQEVTAAANLPPGACHFPEAGCFVWGSEHARLFFRCPTWFLHRPAQADLLHVDIEWRGQPIAHDAGTFCYNTKGAFRGALKEAAVHNTVTFDEAEPMQKAGRFLYLPWPKGEAGWNPGGREFSAKHDGWRGRGIAHRRTVAMGATGTFTVTDAIHSAGLHRGRLHWLLADLPHRFDPGGRQIVLQTAAGPYTVCWSRGEATLVRAAANTNRGWWSPYYYRAAPALSLAIEFECQGTTELTTTFAPVLTDNQ